MASRKIVLVTGAGSGLGLESALTLAEAGYRVYGTVLDLAERTVLTEESSRRNLDVHPTTLDVTNHSMIESVVRQILEEAGQIDALVQFAGLGLRGFFEDLTLEEIRRVYEVNVFGMMAMTQAVLPEMRKRRSGRIVLTSSVVGRMGAMSISGYSSTKFAVEGFAECLAQELAPFGIWVSLIEPGFVNTPHFSVNRNRARRATSPSSPYYAWFCQHEKIVDDILRRRFVSPADVAKVLRRVMAAPRPKLRYVVGWRAKFALALRRHLPGEVYDRLYWPMVQRMVTAPRTPAPGLSQSP